MRNFARRAISLLCVLSMLFSMVITSSAQQSGTTISVISQTIEQGSGTEEVEVPIKILNNTGILGMTVSVTFDDELTLVNAVKGEALSSLTFAKSKNFTDVPYNLVWDGEASADTNNGVIATLTFEVPKGTAKDYAINIEASGVYDDNVEPLYPTTVNGKITVEGKIDEPTSETTINVENQTIEQGTGTEDVEVPIKISNNSGILGMTVSVTFDDELTLVNAVKGDALNSLTFSKSKNFTDVPYNLVWDGEASADTNNGVIATLTFTVPKGTVKDYAINIEASGVYDDNVNPLYPTTINGKISVSDNEHNHSYGDWVKDNDNTHSKTCECGDVVTEAHNWDDGEVTTPATHTTTGIKTYTCSECNGTKTEIIPADSDNHTFGEWEKADDTNHSRECACGETETATHNWNDGEVTTPATHTATGIKTFTCSECNGTKTEIIPADSDNHTFGEWEKVDDTNHSRECACGETETAAHTWNDGEVTTAATHTTTGVKTFTCGDCGATKTETIDRAPTHSHGAWTRVDDNTHSKSCACGDEITENHNWDAGVVTTQPTYSSTGIKTYTCPDCSATKTETIPVLTHVSSGRGGVTKYTVKYETNGGNVIKSVSVRRNSLLTKPTDPTKEGFEFDGWYIDKNLTEIYDFTSKVTKGFTLYAKWTEIEKEPEIIEPDKEQDFVDVSEEDWFDNSVKYVVNNNLMNGVSDKEFAPNAAVTRAMLVTVLYRNEGEPATNKSIPFADVDMSTYYANAVSWAKQNGIVSGVSGNTFAPDANITREQIAAIMHRYAKYKGYDVSVGENTNILSYDDFDSISEYAIASMQYVVGSGLIKGKSETTLNPLDSATRAEIAAILQRFIEANK